MVGTPDPDDHREGRHRQGQGGGVSRVVVVGCGYDWGQETVRDPVHDGARRAAISRSRSGRAGRARPGRGTQASPLPCPTAARRRGGRSVVVVQSDDLAVTLGGAGGRTFDHASVTELSSHVLPPLPRSAPAIAPSHPPADRHLSPETSFRGPNDPCFRAVRHRTGSERHSSATRSFDTPECAEPASAREETSQFLRTWVTGRFSTGRAAPVLGLPRAGSGRMGSTTLIRAGPPRFRSDRTSTGPDRPSYGRSAPDTLEM